MDGKVNTEGADKNKTGSDGADGADMSADELQQLLAQTSFKTPTEAIKGYLNLKQMADSQGNELGMLRKQSETLATILKEKLTADGKPAAAPATPAKDYDGELATIGKQIQDLDPMDKDYQRTLASLVAKSNKLTAQSQHEKTMAAAGELLKKELSQRDVEASQQRFYDENPEFNTPEMQARIQEYIQKDRTRMSDPLSAFREIQRDDALAEKERLAAENAELKRLVELNQGEGKTGKVVVKGNTPPQEPTKPQGKATGKALDEGMRAILDGLAAK